MTKNYESLTFDRYNGSFTHTMILTSYCLKVLSTPYLISIYEYQMKKSKRTATFDLFLMKKLKNISIASSTPNPSVDAFAEITDVNLNQHAISSHVNNMTVPLLSSKKNHSFTENNCDCLISSTHSNEEDQFLYSTNFRHSNSGNVGINLQEPIIVNNHENKTANVSSSTSLLRDILLREKLIRNLKPITKMWIFF